MIPWIRVERLEPRHQLGEFSCGDDAMDAWFKQAAGTEQSRGGCSVHVCVAEAGTVCGFFALISHQIRGTDAPRSLAGGLATVPATLLGRLGRDLGSTPAGSGVILLMEALRAAVEAAEIVGSRPVVLDAKNETLAAWYRRVGLEPFPNDPLRMGMKMSSARVAVEKAFGPRVQADSGTGDA